jgi:hypothetical protein
MIHPPYNLDGPFVQDMETFRHQCANLMYKAVRATIAKGVPGKSLYSWSMDPDSSITWNPLPDVTADFIEFYGQVWRYGDTEYPSFRVDRALMDDLISIEDWATLRKFEYDKSQESLAVAKQTDEQKAREERRKLYLSLKPEFETEN